MLARPSRVSSRRDRFGVKRGGREGEVDFYGIVININAASIEWIVLLRNVIAILNELHNLIQKDVNDSKLHSKQDSQPTVISNSLK